MKHKKISAEKSSAGGNMASWLLYWSTGKRGGSVELQSVFNVCSFAQAPHGFGTTTSWQSYWRNIYLLSVNILRNILQSNYRIIKNLSLESECKSIHIKKKRWLELLNWFQNWFWDSQRLLPCSCAGSCLLLHPSSGQSCPCSLFSKFSFVSSSSL